MSAVYFHSPSEADVIVRGWERAYAGHLTRKLGFDTLRKLFHDEADLREIISGPLKAAPSGAWRGRQWVDDVELYMGGYSCDQGPNRFLFRGEELNNWHVLLNTAIVAGSDAVRFLARFDAQCEIHGRIEGPDRAWAADIIEFGRSQGVMRFGSGWEDVIDLLRRRDDEPVVMSYTVCDSFPDIRATTWKPDESKFPRQLGECSAGHEDRSVCNEYICWEITEDYLHEYAMEQFAALSNEEQWRYGLEYLREYGPRIQPDEWETYRFGQSVSAFDMAADRWERIMEERRQEAARLKELRNA